MPLRSLGSTISVVDTQAKKIVSEYGPAQGVFGPDDVAFNSEGDFYWTSILTGQVAGFLSDGTLVTAAELGPGVNPITFSDDDRLFVSQCFFGTGLYEVDPSGTAPARSIRDDLGPGCGLNGMDWGPDGRLYGPRWFNGEVISVDVETGESRTEVTGLMVPAAVKFDSRGRLHILDTGSGEVIRQEADGRNAVVATLSQGLDNFAFDKADNLFVSSYADGFISKVTSEGVEEVLPGGLSHPGGLVVLEGNLVVADIQSVRAVNARTGDDVWTLRNIFQFAPIGTATCDCESRRRFIADQLAG
jgi:sugar lactone lactonase YvrE